MGNGGLLGFLKDKVPDLAVAVGDTLTGGAVSRIADAVGIDTSDPKTLERRLRSNPKLLKQLKQQERRLAFKELRTRIEDKQSARRMAIEQGGGTAARMGWVILVGFFVLVIATIAAAVWVPNVDRALLAVLAQLIGMASAKANQVASFYFGSSTGSKHKDAALNDEIERLHSGGKGS